jgi:hypothetical protein
MTTPEIGDYASTIHDLQHTAHRLSDYLEECTAMRSAIQVLLYDLASKLRNLSMIHQDVQNLSIMLAQACSLSVENEAERTFSNLKDVMTATRTNGAWQPSTDGQVTTVPPVTTSEPLIPPAAKGARTKSRRRSTSRGKLEQYVVTKRVPAKSRRLVKATGTPAPKRSYRKRTK